MSGALDHDFDEHERDAREQLLEAKRDSAGQTHDCLGVGEVAIDLVTRQPLFIVGRVADDIASYYEETGFDLLNYKQHKFLPIHIDDAVFECVFIGGVEGLHKFSNTYDYPAGRLARVPVEIAVEGDG